MKQGTKLVVRSGHRAGQWAGNHTSKRLVVKSGVKGGHALIPNHNGVRLNAKRL